MRAAMYLTWCILARFCLHALFGSMRRARFTHHDRTQLMPQHLQVHAQAQSNEEVPTGGMFVLKPGIG
jgi:hypothetical protein